jgi:hypothetical protein
MGEAQTQQPPSASGSRVELINTVQKPLGFFVLVVLVVEVILGIVAGLSEGRDRTYLIVGMLVLIFALVGIVTAMALWRPESLQGLRPHFPLHISPTASALPEVLRVSRPAVLCAASTQYETIGFDKDVDIVERFAAKSRIVHDLTSPLLRRLLTEREFHIVHLLNFVEPGDGTLVFDAADRMSSEGFATLLELCKAQLVVLASCDSINLAAKVSRRTNIIAATTTMNTRDFEQWAECFYSLLFRGHSLSRAFEVARTTTNAPMVLLMKQDFVIIS